MKVIMKELLNDICNDRYLSKDGIILKLYRMINDLNEPSVIVELTDMIYDKIDEVK